MKGKLESALLSIPALQFGFPFLCAYGYNCIICLSAKINITFPHLNLLQQVYWLQSEKSYLLLLDSSTTER